MLVPTCDSDDLAERCSLAWSCTICGLLVRRGDYAAFFMCKSSGVANGKRVMLLYFRRINANNVKKMRGWMRSFSGAYSYSGHNRLVA